MDPRDPPRPSTASVTSAEHSPTASDAALIALCLQHQDLYRRGEDIAHEHNNRYPNGNTPEDEEAALDALFTQQTEIEAQIADSRAVGNEAKAAKARAVRRWLGHTELPSSVYHGSLIWSLTTDLIGSVEPSW